MERERGGEGDRHRRMTTMSLKRRPIRLREGGGALPIGGADAGAATATAAEGGGRRGAVAVGAPTMMAAITSIPDRRTGGGGGRRDRRGISPRRRYWSTWPRKPRRRYRPFLSSTLYLLWDFFLGFVGVLKSLKIFFSLGSEGCEEAQSKCSVWLLQ